MNCPLCGQRQIGKIGNEQYYCWNCCAEFTVHGLTVKAFNIDTDGSLIACEESEGETAHQGKTEGVI